MRQSPTLQVVVDNHRHQNPRPPVVKLSRRRQQQLITEHVDLVDRIARKVKRTDSLPACIDLDDLKGAGAFGLVQAARRYRTDMGASFATYVSRRIRGEMKELSRRRPLRESMHESLSATANEEGKLQARPLPDPQSLRGIHAVETRQTVTAILGRLEPDRREILDACYLQGGGLQVVARRRKVSLKAAAELVNLALESAREAA